MYGNIKVALNRRNLRQEDAAQLIGTSGSQVCRVINGTRKPGRLGRRLGILLGVPESWLFRDAGLPKR